MGNDLAAFAKENGVKYFMISYTDLFSGQRAKLVPAQAIADMQKDGAGFAGFATWLDLTPGGVVKHLAHMEDHWFVARVGGGTLPEPWAGAPADQQDWDFRSAADDTVTYSVALYCADVDGVVAEAEQAGAVIREKPQDFATGDRFASLRDPFGVRWTVMTRVEDVSAEERDRRLAAWAKENVN